MWIEKQTNGKVKYCDRVKDITGKVRKITCTMEKHSRKNEDTARDILRQKAIELNAVKDNSITFFEIIDLVNKKYFSTLKESSRYIYNHKIKKIKATNYDIALSDINTRYIISLIEQCTTSDDMYNKYLKLIKTILKKAYKYDYLNDISFLGKFDYKKIIKQDDGIFYYELEDIQKIISNINDVILKNVMEFLLNTGLRIGELLALEYTDLNNDILTINKTKTRQNNIQTTKTKSSNRTISLNKKCLDILESQKRIKVNAKFLYPKTKENNFIFIGTQGNSLTYDNLMKKIEKEIKVPIKLHSLRHTHASLCIDNGISVELISKRLGHETTEITQKIYIHKTKKMQEKEYEAFRNIIF